MKTTLLIALAIASFATRAFAQGTVILNPVPVTNSLTGALAANSSFLAAIYYSPAGAPLDSLTIRTPLTTLTNGYAIFGSQSNIPGVPSGTALQLCVRAWSNIYPSYETALASGLPTALVGQSILFNVTTGGNPLPPPVPSPLNIPGFTLYPVPEASTSTLLLAAFATLVVFRHRHR
jgi:hypothetical protein